jgi:hypothetical protein
LAVTLSIEYSGFSVNLAAAMVPVALYFFLIGLLNSRRHPQLLTARQDFSLLVVALCPLVVLPILQALQVSSLPAIAIVAGVVGLGVYLLGPQGRSLVIYNVSLAEARKAVSQALLRAGLPFEQTQDGFRIATHRSQVKLSAFPLLRNVTVSFSGDADDDWTTLERCLHRGLSRVEVEPAPMAVAMLLVATAMIVTPLSLVARDRGPEIVRILTDLIR